MPARCMDFKIAMNVSLYYIYVSADEMRKDRIVETDHWSEQVKISVMVGDKGLSPKYNN